MCTPLFSRIGVGWGVGAIFLLGCAARGPRIGLVDTSQRAPRLVETTGESWRLILDESVEEQEIRSLAGCTLRIDGQPIGRRLVVNSYRVIDAGDGSTPFIGRLERTGFQWMLHDRQSGSTLLLEGERVADLNHLNGTDILVVGFVSGPSTVRVVAFRGLRAKSEPER